MTITESKEAIRVRGVPFGDVYERLEEHNREVLRQWFLYADGVPNLAAREAAKPSASGNLCKSCGGFLVRTGTCETCQSCGESSGGCG